MRGTAVSQLLGRSLLGLAILVTTGCHRGGFGDPEEPAIAEPDEPLGVLWAASQEQLWKIGGDYWNVEFASGRYTLDGARSLSPVSADGSVWLVDKNHNQIVHLDSEAEEVFRSEPLFYLGYLWNTAVDETDQSVWVSDKYNLRHFDASGELLVLVQDAWDGCHEEPSLVVHPFDRSVWFAHTEDEEIWKHNSDGSLAWGTLAGDIARPHHLAPDPTDGSTWVVDTTNQILVKLDAAGSELYRSAAAEFGELGCLVRANDGTLWACRLDGGGAGLVHISAAGTDLADSPVTSGSLTDLSLVAADGSFWAIDGSNAIVHWSATGVELLRSTTAEYGDPDALVLDAADGHLWFVNDSYGDAVVLLDGDGNEIRRTSRSLFSRIDALALDPTSGDIWIGDGGDDRVLKLDGDGVEILRSENVALSTISGMAVRESDGALWIADSGLEQVIALDVDGSEFFRTPPEVELCTPSSLAVVPSDDTIWLTDRCEVIHLDAAGEVLLRVADGQLADPRSISLDPLDESVWLLSYNDGRVAHLAPDGTVLGATGLTGLFVYPRALAVAADGAVWIANTDRNHIVILNADLSERFSTDQPSYYWPNGLAANVVDDSVWVADTDRNQLARLNLEGQEIYRSPTNSFPDVRLVVAGSE